MMRTNPPAFAAATMPPTGPLRLDRRRLLRHAAGLAIPPVLAATGLPRDRIRAQVTTANPSTPTMDAVATTQSGQVRGDVTDGVYAFKGIPFAAPPFGANRLLPPQPVEPWAEVRDVLAFGPKSPQPPYPPVVALLLPELVGPGEDCLTLNVWTPDLGAAGLPVMVWIPGGMFEYHGTGAAPWYDGSGFARDGVVCVTINYRVGADGFLDLGDGNANRGLLDQIAALEWVQANIARFGGDPGNVTLFGESAGALSIGTMLAIPRAEGLFRRAILQSGGAHQVISRASARRITEDLAARLEVAPTQAALAAVPVARLLEAQTALDADLATQPDPARWGAELLVSGLAWQPVIDGDLLPARPIERIAAGASAAVDVLAGSNADEFNLFLVTDGTIDRITDEVLVGTLARYGLPVETALATYRAERPGASAGELFSAVQGDWWFRIPALQLAEAHAKVSMRAGATYLYEFAWHSPRFDGRLGASHALEIPFVFDTLDRETEKLWGSNPPQALADAMHAAWMAFAATGALGWPTYDLRRRATMRFDTRSEVVDDLRPAVRELWQGRR